MDQNKYRVNFFETASQRRREAFMIDRVLPWVPWNHSMYKKNPSHNSQKTQEQNFFGWKKPSFYDFGHLITNDKLKKVKQKSVQNTRLTILYRYSMIPFQRHN